MTSLMKSTKYVRKKYTYIHIYKYIFSQKIEEKRVIPLLVHENSIIQIPKPVKIPKIVNFPHKLICKNSK